MTKTQDVSHDKACTMCGTLRSVLIRCQIDETEKWHFICPGKCWQSVSGGFEDAKGHEDEFPYYRYGGMWKNRHADGATSAKKPRAVKERQRKQIETEAPSSKDGNDAPAPMVQQSRADR